MYLVSIALADEPDAPPAAGDGWIDLGPAATLPSAIEAAKDAVDSPPSKGLKLRARWGVRPWLGVTGLPGESGGWGGTAGVQVGHQWWSLRETTVRPAGETRLRLAAPFGGVAGWQLVLDSAAGVWIGPVGILVGPALRADQIRWHGGASLAAALTLGPAARVAVKIGPVTPWIAASPTWILAGSRAGLAAPWDEFQTEGGIAISSRPLAFRLGVTRTATSAGAYWEAALGVHVVLL